RASPDAPGGVRHAHHVRMPHLGSVVATDRDQDGKSVGAGVGLEVQQVEVVGARGFEPAEEHHIVDVLHAVDVRPLHVDARGFHEGDLGHGAQLVARLHSGERSVAGRGTIGPWNCQARTRPGSAKLWRCPTPSTPPWSKAVRFTSCASAPERSREWFWCTGVPPTLTGGGSWLRCW